MKESELSQFLGRLKKNAESGFEFVREAEEEIKKLKSYRNKLSDQMLSEDLKNKAFLMAIDSVGDSPARTLAGLAQIAANNSKEYSLAIFLNGLTTACYTDGIITISRAREWEVEVKIDLNKSAGTIEEYANAVKCARADQLANKPKYAKFFANPALASAMWREKIYAVGREGKGEVPRRKFNKKTRQYETINVVEKYKEKYMETILQRFKYFVRPAPWWSLLDKGNAIGMSSDRGGGVPYPVVKAYNFVEKAENEIKYEVKGYMNKHWTKLFEKLEKKQKEIQNQIDRIYMLVEELTEEVVEDTPQPKSYTKAKVYERPAKSFFKDKKVPPIFKEDFIADVIKARVMMKDYDESRIRRVVERITAGEIITEKVTVGKNVRVRVKQIINTFAYLFD